MVTTLHLQQCQAPTEYRAGVDIHLIGVFERLTRRGMAENKQVCTGISCTIPSCDSLTRSRFQITCSASTGLSNSYSLCG
jgi:hypothetical protein